MIHLELWSEGGGPLELSVVLASFIASIFNKLHNYSSLRLQKDYKIRIKTIMVKVIDQDDLFKK